MAPTLIDDAVVAGIKELAVLAPLHNPANALGIDIAREAFPDLPHVAIFDTAFHATLPPHAYTYALPREWGIRRYGFHGTSHAYVSRAAAALLGRPVEELRLIVLHLGNGASACAVDGGRSVDTSMGLTPLAGLVMGTRSGDVDAALVPHLRRTMGMSVEEIDTALNTRSGLLRAGGRERPARGAPPDRGGRRARRPRAGGLLLPDPPVRRLVPGGARRRRRDRLHRGRGRERPGRAGSRRWPASRRSGSRSTTR